VVYVYHEDSQSGWDGMMPAAGCCFHHSMFRVTIETCFAALWCTFFPSAN
jgi:hypothetical protein